MSYLFGEIYPLKILAFRGIATGGRYIGIYTPQNQSTLQIFMWLLVVFLSLSQDKFDIEPVCALARVSFTYLHTTIYTLPNEIPGYAPAGFCIVTEIWAYESCSRAWRIVTENSHAK